MKQFAKDILYTFPIICLLLFALELIIDFHPNEFTSKYNYWHEHRDEITTLLIGNSHVQMNINAEVIGPNAYNMAIGASGTYAVEIAKAYIFQMANIENIIVNFDYLPVTDDKNLSDFRKKEKPHNPDNDNWDNYINYIHHRYLHIDTSCSHYDFAILCGQLHYSTLLTKNLTDLNQNKLNGEYEDEHNFNIGEASLKEYYSLVERIISIAEIASEKKVNLIVVTPPVFGPYHDQINPQTVNLMNTTMDSLSHIYPIKYKNYLLDTSFLHKELFADVHHLNRRGAKVFTKKIINDFCL